MTVQAERPRLVDGFPEARRAAVARLFWAAFSDKLGRIMAPEDRALGFLERALRPDHAISALDAEEQVLGVAGLKTEAGGLLAAGFRELADVYGVMGALWRSPILDLTERRIAAGQVLIDGVFVAPEARGRGIGTSLIEAVVARAGSLGLREVRLDVIDTNPRAAALYLRLGFRPVATRRLGPLGWALGYSAYTTMVRPLTGAARTPG